MLCRLLNDDAVTSQLQLHEVLQAWQNSIQNQEQQNKLLRLMQQIRIGRMTQFNSFYNLVIQQLRQASTMLQQEQAKALEYWIKNGSLSNLHTDDDTFPNVTLTCINPKTVTGRKVYENAANQNCQGKRGNTCYVY